MQITLTNLGTVTPDEAEETLQTVTDFLKGLNLEKLITLLVRNPDRYSAVAARISPEDFVTTLNRTIYAAVADRLAAGLDVDLLSLSGSLEDRAIARMDGEALRRCLAGMEERYANLLMLRFYHGFQNKEIAGLLGMSQTQVAMGIYRARQKLMQMMKGGTDQDGT